MSPEALNKRAYLPALVGAGVSLFLLRSSIFALLFLVPLGFIAFRYNHKTAWTAAFFAVLGNALLVAALAASQGFPVSETIWDLLYFTGMAFIFVWITAPPPFLSARGSGAIRLMAGSCLGALLFTGVFFKAVSSPLFVEYINHLLEMLAAYRSSGGDVVQNAQMGMPAADDVLREIKNMLLRGGSLISCVLIFSVCRQMSFFFARFFGRDRNTEFSGSGSPGVLAAFHVHPALIWVFSSSLLLVIFTRTVNFEIPEIILWNILILCAILYFAQGFGILQFFTSRPSVPPFFRPLFNVLFVVLLFSPFLNVVLLAGTVLLGAAENWVPFRAPKQNSPPSTPEDRGDDFF